MKRKMAQLNLPILATLLMLLITFSSLSPTTADETDIAVLDTTGNPLIAGEFYYALPTTMTSIKGGLTMFNNDSATCPTFIPSLSTFGSEDFGIPIVFFPENTQQTDVLHGYPDYNIGFKYLSILPECRRMYTTVWTVSIEESSQVMLDGEKGDQVSWFKIKESEDKSGYVIRYSSTSLGGSLSKDVGFVSNQVGASLLTVDDSATPLVVVFVKA